MIDSVRPSVCLSVTVWYHVKMTQVTIMRSSRQDTPVTLQCSFLVLNFTATFQREHRVQEWEMVRWIGKIGSFLANKSPYLRNGARQDHSYNGGLIGSHICTFDWYQYYRPCLTLNGRYAPYYRKGASFGAHGKNWIKIDPNYQRQKCRPWSSFWKYKVYADIHWGSSR